MPTNYKCVFCNKFLTSGTSPWQASCGDRLCGTCKSEQLQKITRQEKLLCPVCQEKIVLEECFRDRAVEQELAKLPVRCRNSNCPWQGLCPDLQRHLDECKYLVICCPNDGCDKKIQRSDLKMHLAECLYGVTPCLWCHREITKGNMPKHHTTDCPAYEMMCPNGCGHNCSRNKMQYHLERDCPLENRKCNVALCQFKGTEEELIKHNKKEVSHHVQCMSRALNQLSTHLAKTDQHDAPSQSTQQQMRAMESRITAQEKTTQELQIEFATKFQPLIETIVKLEPAVLKLQEGFGEMALLVQALQATSYNGRFTWKIPEIQRRRHEAKIGKTLSLYSAPFYTSRHGYKACLRLYMDGDGSGKGSQLSFFLTLMKGEYDALLPWPFKQTVTMMLLDQDKQKDIVQSFRPESTSSSFQRPRNEMNVASGCPMFAPLSILNNVSFVKDDTMFLCCRIDSSGIEDY